MQNVCNTYSRILIQQSEIFIFLGILVLGLHPVPNYACGVWTYKLPLRPTTPEAVYTSDKSQDSNRVGHKFSLRLLVRLGSHFTFLFGTNFMLIRILLSF